jgi:hypothetical protein
MTIKKPCSRIFLVNLFADFILSKIPNTENSIINVVDCKNFFVVKGKTSSKDLLNLSEIITEFSSKFSSYIIENKITHTIDLIEYDQELKSFKDLTFTYYNSDNCSYHYKQIQAYKEKESTYDYIHFLNEITDDESIIQSEFPHGYSLGQGRLLYYYGKHIMYNIPSNYPVTYLTFNLSTEKNEDGEQLFSIDKNEELTSAVLDVFDFDMSWLETEIKKVDWSVELINPLQDYDFLKRIIDGFIII